MLSKDYAEYTITLHDALVEDTSLLDDFVLDTTAHTDAFKKVFSAMWDIYEIAGETIPQFKRFINNRFAVNKDYYIELLNSYETKINMLDGKKTTKKYTESDDRTTYDSTDTTTHNADVYTPNVTTFSDSKHIDLPNKVIAEGDRENYLSTEDKDTTSHTGNDNTTSDGTIGETYNGTDNRDISHDETITGGISVIDLKKDYMDMLRNVYEEFAREFHPCFLHIFGSF